MHGTIALVTGGATGIGKACSQMLARDGFKVAIHYNQSREAAESLCNELPGAFTLQGDLASIEDIERVCTEIKNRAANLSVVVNNAGIVYDNPIFSAGLEEFDKTIQTNLRGTWYLTKRLARLMMRQKYGRIINISSVVGHTGNPAQSIYGMTKAAIDNLTKSLASEFAPFGILVNSVAPGFIDTAMTRQLSAEVKAKILERVPLARMGSPDEVAEAVSFLATKATYCSGTIFHVNGGMYGG